MTNGNWSSLKRRSEKIQRYGFLFPLCLLLIIIAVFPLSYGIAERKLLIALLSGAVETGSWVVLILYTRSACRLSDEMLEDGKQFLAVMEAELDRLNKGPSWLAFRKFLKRCGI